MINGYRFQFKWFNVLLFISLFSVFCTLTIWQVIRIDEKQAILNQIQNAESEGEYISLNSNTELDINKYEFYPVSAYGTFDMDNCFYLENIVFEKEAGKYFYCPFALANTNSRVVVNLGWVKNSDNRLDLPTIDLPQDALVIKGKVNRIRSLPVVMTSDIPNTEKDNLWLYFDLDFLAKKTKASYLPLEMRLTELNEGVLTRKWPEYNPKIGMHIGYVLHWFAFAFVSLLLFIKFNFKKVDD